MNFISLEFIFGLPLALFLYWKVPLRHRWIGLLGVSYLAYTYWNGADVLLMLVMTVLTFILTGRIAKAGNSKTARNWLILTIALCLGVFLGLRSQGYLPVGISFYTFQMLSYVFEVYRKEIQEEKQLPYYALYISFFPQLVAGPIERPERLLTQMHRLPGFSADNLVYGGLLILRGFFKKIVVADYLAAFVDQAYGNVQAINGPAAVFATACFAFQIYCDFSGYSDIAVGAARLFGIRLMENFNTPYLATSLRDFWHRWHISLTAWFTDYVYKPLGGSRKGRLRTCANTMVVFLLSGLWHGLSWTYVIWGAIHGCLLVLENLLTRRAKSSGGREQSRRKTVGEFREPGEHKDSRNPGEYGEQRDCRHPQTTGFYIKRTCKIMVNFAIVCFAWIFFRATSLGDALTVIGRLATGWNVSGFSYVATFLTINMQSLLRIGFMLLALFFLKDMPTKGEQWRQRYVSLGFVAFCMILIIVFAQLNLMASNGGNAFIYFQF